MKNKYLKSIFFLVIVSTFFLGACKKKIEEAYLNPNAQTIQPIESILPGVIGGFTWFASNAGTAFGVVTDGSFIGRYIQYFGIRDNGDSWGRMSHLGGAVDNGGSVWGAFYYAHGQNVNRIIEWGTEQQKWDYVGVAWAIRAWGLLELTNEYGEAPLKQAFNSNLSQFLYDTQPEFYEECRVTCHKALSFLNRTDGNVSQQNLALGDAYFLGGDVNKWKKFVYGVLARSYINLSSKDIFKTNNYADSAIKYANLSITNNDDNATVKVAGGPSSNLNNWWGPFRANVGTYRQGVYIANLMSGANTVAFTNVPDPRRWYMLSENA
ncbi:MAG TPA: SusD/RagB family nutrient-binding outer membrane lipoprotein, partial [Segetibacter sp.]